MSTTPTGRKAPHCKKCHQPLKGHRRGVCDTTEQDIKSSTPETSLKSRTRRKSAPLDRTVSSVALSDAPRQRKSAPFSLDNDTLPSLSPQSSEILHNLLRENSLSDPATSAPTSGKKPWRSVHFDQVEQTRLEESLPDALEKLSTKNKEEEEVDNVVEEGFTPQPKADCESSIKYEVPDSVSTKESLVTFLTSMFQNPQHPPATMFSFPFADLLMLRSAVSSQKLYMCILTLPETDAEDGKLEVEWVPVIVGRTLTAITKLLEEGERVADALEAMNSKEKTPVAKMRLVLSHVAVGTLGALATWAGLAYT
ncbi:hypothetical protein BU17DRAFT_60605 [Hysterangium stoloniferum]|nr:hypothetical protein BU17DRAFT_60605 [Hysterangium stoloniferum]